MKPGEVRFMLYLRVLLRYLQRKHEADDGDDTYKRLKLALHDCASKSRRQEKGFESLTMAMHRIIPQVVRREDLAKAREYTNLLMQKKRQLHDRRQGQAFQHLDPNAS